MVKSKKNVMLEDERIKEILSSVTEIIEREESGLSIVNPERVRDFYTCSELLRLVIDSDMELTVKAHNQFASIGTITAVARRFHVLDTELFAIALRLASNYEIYPRLDGSLVMELTFYSMTEKAGV